MWARMCVFACVLVQKDPTRYRVGVFVEHAGTTCTVIKDVALGQIQNSPQRVSLLSFTAVI